MYLDFLPVSSIDLTERSSVLCSEYVSNGRETRVCKREKRRNRDSETQRTVQSHSSLI